MINLKIISSTKRPGRKGPLVAGWIEAQARDDGGVSVGTPATKGLKGDLATMKIVPLTEGVNFSMFTQFFNEKGEFAGNEFSIKSTKFMLDELVRWTKGLILIKENTL